MGKHYFDIANCDNVTVLLRFLSEINNKLLCKNIIFRIISIPLGIIYLGILRVVNI